MGWGGELSFSGSGVRVWKDEKVAQMDGGDDHGII